MNASRVTDWAIVFNALFEILFFFRIKLCMEK